VTDPHNYKISKDDALAGTEVFIDPNTLAADGTASIGSTSWSEDGKYMAYNINLAGSDWATIKVRDAATCKDLENDELKWVKFSGCSWLKDSSGFFYSKFDAPVGKDEKGAGTETE
jgi:prolyl oligopeptidase